MTIAASAMDTQIRQAAFDHLRRLVTVRGELTSEDIRAGFVFQGTRIPLINPQRGIFKPRQMQYLFSIRTVFPRKGSRVWYDDQREVHRQIYQEDEMVDYAFMGNDPNAADNRWLREAYLHQVPLVYFLGTSPGRYQANFPVFIQDWDANALRVRVAFGLADQPVWEPPENASERRYALRSVKQRLHQASFREAVITAYAGRCALSNLPEHRLLDAAHIISDRDKEWGQPIVANGLPLSKIHHAAFDAHLIGIDPDYRIHVSSHLLDQQDGPLLEAMKQLHGGRIRDPMRDQDRADKERLALRFETYLQAQVNGITHSLG